MTTQRRRVLATVLAVTLAAVVVLFAPADLPVPYLTALAVAVGAPVVHGLTYDVPADAVTAGPQEPEGPQGTGGPAERLGPEARARAVAALASGCVALVVGLTVAFGATRVIGTEVVAIAVVGLLGLTAAKSGFEAGLGDHPWLEEEEEGDGTADGT